jgi:hypothetical protein
MQLCVGVFYFEALTLVISIMNIRHTILTLTCHADYIINDLKL